MPATTLAAVAVWATFLFGMLVGVALVVYGITARGRGSIAGARLLLSGPAGALCGSAVFVAGLDLPAVARLFFVVLLGGSGVAAFIFALGASMSSAPMQLGRARAATTFIRAALFRPRPF